VRVGGAALPRDVVLARRLEASKELGRAERRRVTEGPSRARRPTPSLARVPWPFPLSCASPRLTLERRSCPSRCTPLRDRATRRRTSADGTAPINTTRSEPTDVGAKYRTFHVIQKRGRGWGFVCGWEEPLCRGTSFSRGGSRQRRSSGAVIARNDAELRRGPPAREGPPPPSRGCRGPSPVVPPCRLRLCRLRRPEPTDVGAKCLTFPAVGIAGRGGPPKLAKPHTSLAAGEPSARREAQNPEA
jgi:hypothetical protein